MRSLKIETLFSRTPVKVTHRFRITRWVWCGNGADPHRHVWLLEKLQCMNPRVHSPKMHQRISRLRIIPGTRIFDPSGCLILLLRRLRMNEPFFSTEDDLNLMWTALYMDDTSRTAEMNGLLSLAFNQHDTCKPDRVIPRYCRT